LRGQTRIETNTNNQRIIDLDVKMMSQTPSQTSAGRAPAHRSISTLFPAPLFEDKSLGKTFGGISRDGSHGWIVGDSELFVFDLQGEDGPRRKAELAADLQEDQATAVRLLVSSFYSNSCVI
jgi:hypothetical protein